MKEGSESHIPSDAPPLMNGLKVLKSRVPVYWVVLALTLCEVLRVLVVPLLSS